MRTTSSDRSGAPPVGWRASAWGGLGGLLALGAAAGLGRQAVAGWPTTGTSGPGQAVLAAMLALAAVLLVRVAAVILVAAWEVRPVTGPVAPRRSSSAAVRVAASLLVCLATGTGAAGAAPVPAVVTTVGDDTGRGDRGPAAEQAAEGVPPGAAPVPLPGWTPSATASPPRPQGEVDLVGGRDAARGELPTHVVVRRGDTLWDLAGRHLGPGATSADVAQEWPRWYAANLEVIGPDPDLILPGQELRVPGTEGSRG